MASAVMHLTIAEFLNTHYFNFKDKDKTNFVLGSIVADFPQIIKKI